MPSIFTKIINGEIPAYKIAENSKFYAFLDVFPIAKGHTLVIPKNEIDNIFDLESEDFKELFGFAKTIGNAIEKAIPCQKVGIAVIGLEVRHAHIHLVPINNMGDMDFAKEKLKLSAQEFVEIQDKIKNFIN